MNANEFRIGNWVILNDDNGKDNGLYKIDAIDINVAVIDKERFYPIPLTPEILLACGFETKNEGHDFGGTIPFQYFDDYRELMIDSISLREEDKNGKYEVFVLEHPKIRVQYLHQLQNLYFALTGTELEVNL